MMQQMFLGLWSMLLMGHVHGFNPPAVLPFHGTQQTATAQPQTAPNLVVVPRAKPYPLSSFLPPTPPSGPALSAIPVGQEVKESAGGEPRLQGSVNGNEYHLQSIQADGGAWSAFAAGIFGTLLGAFSVLGARMLRGSPAASDQGSVELHQNLFSMAVSDSPPCQRTLEPVYAASPELRGAFQGPLVAHYDQPQEKAGPLNPAAAVANGLLAASLLLTPALDVVHGNGFSAGGAANAQGFVSSKSTAGSPTTDANKDPESILRLSLPINPKNPIRVVQAELELKMEKALRETRPEKWDKVKGYTKKATSILSGKEKDILADVPAERKGEAAETIKDIKSQLDQLAKTVEGKKVAPVTKAKAEVLSTIGDLEQLMVKGFPFEVPAEYSNLPQLKGRAEVEFTIRKADPEAQFDIQGTLYEKAVLKVVVDGYSAPVNAGNFIELVTKGLYNGMAIQRSDGFVIQTGDVDPDGGPKAVHGFKGPDGKERTVPLEVYALEDNKPTYEITFEDDGRPLSQPKLPFSVYGTLASARSEDNANDASSQFFFLLFDPELTTSGRNLMDGRFSTFGYVTNGNILLENVEVGDVIESVKVTEGLENLVAPKK